MESVNLRFQLSSQDRFIVGYSSHHSISKIKAELLVPMSYSFHWKASPFPGFQSSFYSLDMDVPCLDEYFRRTGACLLVRSGTIGYDLIIPFKLTICFGHGS